MAEDASGCGSSMAEACVRRGRGRDWLAQWPHIGQGIREQRRADCSRRQRVPQVLEQRTENGIQRIDWLSAQEGSEERAFESGKPGSRPPWQSHGAGGGTGHLGPAYGRTGRAWLAQSPEKGLGSGGWFFLLNALCPCQNIPEAAPLLTGTGLVLFSISCPIFQVKTSSGIV